MCRNNREGNTIKSHKKGYTLAELLIVVAIIGILVAVSIPIFASQLRKARVAVDLANARAGKAAMVAYILTYPETYIDGNEHTLCYDASTGKVVATRADAEKLTSGYGKTSDVKGPDNVDNLLATAAGASDLRNCVVTGTFYVDGTTIYKDDDSESKIIGDQIKIMWVPVSSVASMVK